MGLFFRKSKDFGFGKLNFSNSGIGFSTGIKGLRFGIDSKGRQYISGGKGAFRFREYLKSDKTEINIDDEQNDIKPKDQAGCLGCLSILAIILGLIYPPMGIFLFFILIYGLPYIIADLNNLPNKTQIYMINICLGWTIIGWLISLAMTINGIVKFKNIKSLEYTLNTVDINNLENVLNNLIAKNPQYSKNYKLKAVKIYKNAGEYQKALDLLNSSDLGETRQLKMGLLICLEQYQDALNLLQKEYTDDEKSEHPIIYAYMAEIFLKLNKPELAFETLKQGPINARKMSDELCAFRYALGEYYEAINDIDNAKKQYQKIYAYNSSYKDIAEKINLI